MEAFTYKGISDGKYVDGDIEALNIDEASHKLKEQKIIITNIVRTSKKKKTEQKDKKKGKGFSLFGKKKPKVEDVLIFSKQFATMVANCLENIKTSSTLGFFLPKRLKPLPFFLSFCSVFFFLEVRTIFVIIIFCSFNL